MRQGVSGHHGSGFTAAEFFAGMGLVRRALDASGVRTVYANDFDACKARLYAASFSDAHEVFDPRDVRLVAGVDVPACDIWTASFPCTDLSLAGSRGGIHAGQSGAVWSVLGLLASLPIAQRPSWVFFENVVGLLTSNHGADLRALVGVLNGLGYGVDPLLIDAVRFTPQSRPRVFLIATRLDAGFAPTRCAPVSLQATWARPRRVVDAVRAAPDLVWHARDVPEPPPRREAFFTVVEPFATDDPRWWSAERTAYFRAQVHPGHEAHMEAAIAGPRVTYATAFRRVRTIHGVKRSVAELRWDGTAGCLRTPKGGSAKQILVAAGAGSLRVRHLVPLECARLQGLQQLPSGFSDSQLLFGLGDAVCVPAVQWALHSTVLADARAGVPAVR